VKTAVQQVLESFDALSEADKHRVAVEILRRVSPVGEGDVPESALVEAADELLRALDAEEASRAQQGANPRLREVKTGPMKGTR
jgi:hypothetical protein